MTLVELNNIAQEIANQLGNISQEKLVEIHNLILAEKANNSVANTTTADS